jgi:hypothetical protein
MNIGAYIHQCYIPRFLHRLTKEYNVYSLVMKVYSSVITDEHSCVSYSVGSRYHSIHRWRCRISTSFLPPQMKKCAMALILPYNRLWCILWQRNQSTTSQICTKMISWSWLLISSQRSTTCQKTCTGHRKLLPVLVWTTRGLVCMKRTACCSRRTTKMIPNVCIAIGQDTWKW